MITGILLAAGQSKRLKNENKLLKKFKNKPLIHHVLKSVQKSKIKKIIIVLGHQFKETKKIIKNNKKFIFVYNKKYKQGISSSIKKGLKKINKQDKGFIILQSDMPFVKTSDINKIYNSIIRKKYLVHALKYKNRIGNPIGFDISILKKFKKIEGNIGAKYMVKRLQKSTNYIKVSTEKVFKDFDKASDFRT
ncbi:NTP transferase domain-containing protein [Candidatus Pelagibacter sp.]|nr:NTP transferase domain-containing protein [Candidatus Pelagibacter sp.]